MREFAAIHTVFTPLALNYAGSLGLRDDAALLRLAQGQELVVTTDAISEGIHFLGTEAPEWIAKKLLRSNLSDLAAMGAKPECYFLSIMLPENTSDAWIARFGQGLAEDQALFGIQLAGGDTITTKGLFSASVTAMGTVKMGTSLRRSGAKAGNTIYVSGTLGDSALGLALLQERLGVEVSPVDSLWLKERYFLPHPRVGLGQKLVGVVSAAMDISDGLVQDLGHICAASGVGAVLHRKWLPLSDAAAHVIDKQDDWWQAVLAGGDDYELLFTVPATAQEQVKAIGEELHLKLTMVGEIVAGEGVSVQDEHGIDVTPERGGYSHAL
jgi:thiamine-monophosphate kinase